MLVKVPVMLTVAGAENVPEFNVNESNVSAVVLPEHESICADLVIVMTLNVCEAAVPWIAWSEEVLRKLTMLDAGVNVAPLFVQFPRRLILMTLAGAKTPVDSSRFPLMFSVERFPAVFRVRVAFAITRVLNVCDDAVPLMVCVTAVFVNETVPLPGMNVPPLFVQFPLEVI